VDKRWPDAAKVVPELHGSEWMATLEQLATRWDRKVPSHTRRPHTLKDCRELDSLRVLINTLPTYRGVHSWPHWGLIQLFCILPGSPTPKGVPRALLSSATQHLTHVSGGCTVTFDRVHLVFTHLVFV